MVLRWTADATAELRRRIDRGQINPNFEDAPYLGDIVSGEHFPEYEALPPTGRQTAIVRFRRLFRRIKLERELQGQRRLAAEGGEEEGKFLVMCFALMCMCAKPDSLLVSVHAEEGIDLDDNFGEHEENLEEDDEQDDEDEGDEDEDEDNEMSRVPPPAGRGRGRGRAAGRAAPAAPPVVRRSPPRPAAAAASAPAADVEMLTDNLARANLSSPAFNFQARFPHVFIPTVPSIWTSNCGRVLAGPLR